ncbi:MAG: HU family DNA-binding protein [Bacteroidaceae bacterium]|nr:HU family DNA-binding protein [Bacteroidaceae bacterium]
MENKITIIDLAEGLAKRKHIQRKDAELFIRTVFDTIQERLLEGDPVKVKGLGTFKLITVNSRESVNVQTGERIVIDSHAKVSFTPEKALSDRVNRPFADFETVALNDATKTEDMERIDLPEPEATEEPTTEAIQAPLADIVEPAAEVAQAEPEEIVLPEPEVAQAEPEAIVEPTPEVVEPTPEVVEEPVVEPVVEETIPEPVVEEEPKVEPIVEEEPKVEPIIEEAPKVEPIVEEAPKVEPIAEEEPKVEPIVEEEPKEEPVQEVQSAPAAFMDKQDKEPAGADAVEKKSRNLTRWLLFLMLLLVAALILFLLFGPKGYDGEAVEREDTTQVEQKDTIEAVPVTPAKPTKSAEELAADYPQIPNGEYWIVGTKTTHVLEKGEDLSKLALEHYGDKKLINYIIHYNGYSMQKASNLFVGTEVKLPELVKKEQ